MEIEGQPTLTLHPGEGFLITPNTPHNALDLGPDTGQMLSTYIVEAGPADRQFHAMTGHLEHPSAAGRSWR
jgi:hypothetical protein